MNVEIVAHDTINGLAEIKFTHNGKLLHEKYELIHVIPGTKNMLATSNTVFDKTMQLKVIDTLTGWVQNMLESDGYNPDLVNSNNPPTVKNKLDNIVSQ